MYTCTWPRSGHFGSRTVSSSCIRECEEGFMRARHMSGHFHPTRRPRSQVAKFDSRHPKSGDPLYFLSLVTKADFARLRIPACVRACTLVQAAALCPVRLRRETIDKQIRLPRGLCSQSASLSTNFRCVDVVMSLKCDVTSCIGLREAVGLRHAHEGAAALNRAHKSECRG